MKTIREIAVKDIADNGCSRSWIDFAESVLAEYLAQQEPVAWQNKFNGFITKERSAEYQNPLFLAPPIKSSWMPIETAPKDGSIYLAYSTEYANKYWVTNKPNGMTHWMPLPDAPQEEQK